MESGHEVVAVLTGEVTGRGASAGSLAEEEGIGVLDPGLVRDDAFADWIAEREIDLLINVHSLHIARAAVVDAPRIGSFNLHPGPLPDYRGLNAPSWAIYDGRDEHAVTLHWMTGDVDAGDIAYEARFPIEPGDTGLSLSVRCVERGVPLVESLLADAANGDIPRLPQPERPSVWHGREAPGDGWVDWTAPARRIEALVRAADFHPLPSPWGPAKARLGDSVIELIKLRAGGESAGAEPGTVAHGEGGEVRIASGDEWVVATKVRLDGRAMRPADALPEGARLG